MRKAFEPELYEKCDSVAKNRVRGFLDKMGVLTLVDEDYGADIRAVRSEFHEVEVKKGWSGEWPASWATVHIPERKKRLLDGRSRGYFWVLSSDFTQAVVIDSRILKDNLLEEVSNCKVSAGEKFFCVPVKKCRFVKFPGVDQCR